MSDTELWDLIPFFTNLSTCDNVYKELRQTHGNPVLVKEIQQIVSDKLNTSSPIASVPQIHKEDNVLIKSPYVYSPGEVRS